MLETVELTMSHSGLDDLTEFALMTLFGAAHSHCITEGTGHSIREIVNKDGQVLYPSYYATHLKVPIASALRTFRLWEDLTVGVQASRFGSMMLQSTYVLSKPGEVDDDEEDWDPLEFPVMEAGSLFILEDGRENPLASAPEPGSLGKLSKVSSPSPLLARFTRARDGVRVWEPLACAKDVQSPIAYQIVAGRDVRPGGNLMFSSFVPIMDYAEQQALGGLVAPGLLAFAQLLERETFYLANCGADATISIDVVAELSRLPAEVIADEDSVHSGLITAEFELRNMATSQLLLLSRSAKLLSAPSTDGDLCEEARRLRESLDQR